MGSTIVDLNDTGTLRQDPLWQLACSDARGLTPLGEARPSQATLSRLLNCLGSDDNIDSVHEGLLRLAFWRWRSLYPIHRPRQVTLDIDGLPIEVFGHQGGSSYNDDAKARIYSPLIASLAETGDMVGGLLREGNAGPAEDADTWIPQCHDLAYPAGSRESPRRVVLVVQEKPDDLLCHAFFLVTNLNKHDYPPEKVLALYRKRGKAEAHMGELKSALNVHLSSTDRGDSTVQQVMARNQVSLLLSLYAYQVLHGLRSLVERQTRQGWSLIRLREQVLKVAATFTVHARQITMRLGAAADRWWPSVLKALPRLGTLS